MVKTKLSQNKKRVVVKISNKNLDIFSQMTDALGLKGLNVKYVNSFYEGWYKVWLPFTNNFEPTFRALERIDGEITLSQEVREAIGKARDFKEKEKEEFKTRLDEKAKEPKLVKGKLWS